MSQSMQNLARNNEISHRIKLAVEKAIFVFFHARVDKYGKHVSTLNTHSFQLK